MTSDLPPTGGPELPPDPPSASSGDPGADPGARPTTTYTEPTAAPRSAGSARPALDELFDRIRSIGLFRPAEGRWVGGVATGIGRRFDLDVTLVRGIFVALSLFGGLGIAAYGLAWLLLPEADGRIHLQQAFRGDFSAGFFGAVILSLAAVGGGGGPGPWRDGFWFGWGFPGGLVLTVLVVLGIYWFAKRTSPPGGFPATSGPTTGPTNGPATGPTSTGTATGPDVPTYGTPYGTPGSPRNAWPNAGPEMGDAARQAGERARLAAAEAARRNRERRERSAPSRRINRITVGLALLTFAVLQIIGRSADWSAPVSLVAATGALAVLAVGVIVTGLTGRRAAGLGGVGILLAIIVLSYSAADDAGVRTGQNVAVAGTQEWRPATLDAAEQQFNLGVGEATLWLTDPGITTAASRGNPVDVSARIGAGHLVVVLPDDVPAQVRVSMGAGEIVNPDGTTREVKGQHSGAVENVATGPAGAPVLVVDVQQGVGQLELKRESSMTTPTPTGSATPRPSLTVTPSPTATPTASATN
jgi:phage shock protein PspC (stress-responsive transcriptional regulator)